MRISKEALATSVVVRRVRTGAAPFRWEVYRAEMTTPIYVSPDRFRSMHEAYQAGQARLADFISKRSMPPGVTENREWQSSQLSPGAQEART
jgi:hypothetical protein